MQSSFSSGIFTESSYKVENAGYAEPDFAYLNRTARNEFGQIRNLLEEWFSRYPVSDQQGLRSRFRSLNDYQHQAAFFELFLHELLLSLNCTVILHPPLEDTFKVPDFFVEPQTNSKFFLEATVATGISADEAAARARENYVYDVLDRLVKSPDYFLWITVNGAPASPPPAKKLASFINSQLVILDYEEIIRAYDLHEGDNLPCWHFEHDGWQIDIRPTPKKSTARGKEGIRPIGARSTSWNRIDSRTPIRDSILKKGNKYGELNLPYVVAVNVIDPFFNEIDIMEALFDNEQYFIEFTEDNTIIPETKSTRIPDGVWFGPNKSRYTRISAVLIVTRLTTTNIPRTELRLYHNPWAQKPYKSVLTRFPKQSH